MSANRLLQGQQAGRAGEHYSLKLKLPPGSMTGLVTLWPVLANPVGTSMSSGGGQMTPKEFYGVPHIQRHLQKNVCPGILPRFARHCSEALAHRQHIRPGPGGCIREQARRG